MGLQARKAASHVTLKDYFKKARESGELGYIGVLQQWVSSGNIRRLVLKKIRNPNVRNLALFYVWEDAKV